MIKRQVNKRQERLKRSIYLEAELIDNDANAKLS